MPDDIRQFPISDVLDDIKDALISSNNVIIAAPPGAAVSEDKRSFAQLGEAGRLVAGTDLPKPSGVFPRYVEQESNA